MEIIRLENADLPYFKEICEICYEWWRTEMQYKRVETNLFYSLNLGSKLPQEFIAIEDNQLLGFYQIAMYDDIDCRPDCYPWLINVFIIRKYHHQGVFTALMQTVYENVQKLRLDELYLYTQHIGLYEKFGWEFVGEIDTFNDDCRIQRLYHFDVKKWLLK